jgi:hypothetical protein
MWTFNYIDWTALFKEAQIFNSGWSCVFNRSYYAGGRYIVRRLKFINGGQLWLIYIPILSASSAFD